LFSMPHLGDSCLVRSRPSSAASCQPRAFPKVHSPLPSVLLSDNSPAQSPDNIFSKLRLEALFSCLPFKNLAQLRTLQLALASYDSSCPSTGKLHSARSWSRVTARSWNIWYWDRRERIRSATMASQAALISETIAGMKKAVKRKAYGMLHPRSILRTPLLISAQTIDSDSDASIDQLTNRGNKLRKKARYVHEGQLAPPSGPQVYKRVRYRFQTTPGLALMHDTENRIRRISSRDHRSESSSCRRRWLRSR
jgi:hypothetical protein